MARIVVKSKAELSENLVCPICNSKFEIFADDLFDFSDVDAKVKCPACRNCLRIKAEKLENPIVKKAFDDLEDAMNAYF